MDEVMRAWLAMIFTCALACRTGASPMAKDGTEMKRHLLAAEQQSLRYFVADAVPEGAAVRALVAAEPGEAWLDLSDEERFLLYELSPESRMAAPADRLARAYCVGLQTVPFEWWGYPGSLSTETSKHLIAVGRAAAPCLRPLLEVATPLRYLNGEANTMVEHFGWIVGDLAADAAARILGVAFDARAPAEARGGRRAELGRALGSLPRP
jgi:hypothetical protein